MCRAKEIRGKQELLECLTKFYDQVYSRYSSVDNLNEISHRLSMRVWTTQCHATKDKEFWDQMSSEIMKANNAIADVSANLEKIMKPIVNQIAELKKELSDKPL